MVAGPDGFNLADPFPPRFVVERITDPRVVTLVEPLLREYVKWVAGRLAADFGLHVEEADLERHHAHFRAEVPKLLGPGGRLLVARRAGEVVGVGAVKPVDTEIAEIKRMYVRPIARGSGVGRAILERLLADARDEGYRVVRLETLPFMLNAHALYRSVGFVDTRAFDGSEAAISGLADLTYYMQLKLLHRRLESTLLDPAVTATGSQAANRTGSGSGAPHGDQLMSMDLADGRHGGNGDARGVPEP